MLRPSHPKASESGNLKGYTLNNAWFSTEAQTFLHNAMLASCGCQEDSILYMWSTLRVPEKVPVTQQTITIIIINVSYERKLLLD